MLPIKVATCSYIVSPDCMTTCPLMLMCFHLQVHKCIPPNMLLLILQKCLNYFAHVLLRSCGEQKMPK